MDERKEKLIAYLKKNLRIAELTVEEFGKIQEEIAELESKLLEKKKNLSDLGDIDTAIANVDEIRGFIDDLTKPVEVPEQDEEIDEPEIEEAGEEIDESAAGEEVLADTNLNGGPTF